MIDLEFYDNITGATVTDEQGNPVSFRGTVPPVGSTLSLRHPESEGVTYIVIDLSFHYYEFKGDRYQICTVTVCRCE